MKVEAGELQESLKGVYHICGGPCVKIVLIGKSTPWLLHSDQISGQVSDPDIALSLSDSTSTILVSRGSEHWHNN
jgi:hypothetical protein